MAHGPRICTIDEAVAAAEWMCENASRLHLSLDEQMTWAACASMPQFINWEHLGLRIVGKSDRIT